jgi:hypothetical protein
VRTNPRIGINNIPEYGRIAIFISATRRIAVLHPALVRNWTMMKNNAPNENDIKKMKFAKYEWVANLIPRSESPLPPPTVSPMVKETVKRISPNAIRGSGFDFQDAGSSIVSLSYFKPMIF